MSEPTGRQLMGLDPYPAETPAEPAEPANETEPAEPAELANETEPAEAADTPESANVMVMPGPAEVLREIANMIHQVADRL